MMYNQFTQGAALYDHDVHHVAQMNAQNVPPDLESQRLTSHPRQTVVESMTAMPIENNNDREDKTKWTTVVIIMLQLAAWSAVGTFLLEKGITTYLHDKNSTAHNVSSSTKLSESSLIDRDIIPTTKGVSWRLFLENEKKVESEDDVLSVIPLDVSSINVTEPTIPKNKLTDSNAEQRHSNRLNELPTQVTSHKGQTVGKPSMTIDNEKTQEEVEQAEPNENVKEKVDTKESVNESRKELRSNFGPTTSATAMIIVGSLMLAFGPLIIVMRAVTAIKEERRFVKLSGTEDCPPSYEQATGCADPAPAYSTLNFDTNECHTTHEAAAQLLSNR